MKSPAAVKTSAYSSCIISWNRKVSRKNFCYSLRFNNQEKHQSPARIWIEKMKILTIQDGNNNIIKTNKRVNQIFHEREQLFELWYHKFVPEVTLCEIILLRKWPKNYVKQTIEEFNKLFPENYGLEQQSNYKVLPINQLIICFNVGNNNVRYHDNLHLNYSKGVPFLKNTAAVKTSDLFFWHYILKQDSLKLLPLTVQW